MFIYIYIYIYIYTYIHILLSSLELSGTKISDPWVRLEITALLCKQVVLNFCKVVVLKIHYSSIDALARDFDLDQLLILLQALSFQYF